MHTLKIPALEPGALNRATRRGDQWPTHREKARRARRARRHATANGDRK